MVNKGAKVKLILVGSIITLSEKEYIDDYIATNNLSDNFEFITDERVYKGSDLLSLGDCIIATGRSVMEAASLNKLILVPTKNQEFTVLLDEQNFEGLFHFNFSGRTTSQYGPDEFKKIERLMMDKTYRDETIKFLTQKCEQYFLLSDDVKSYYCKIYCNIQYQDIIYIILKNILCWTRFLLRNEK